MKRIVFLVAIAVPISMTSPSQAQFGSVPIDSTSQPNQSVPQSVVSTPRTTETTHASQPVRNTVPQTYSSQAPASGSVSAGNVYTPPAPPQTPAQPAIGPDKKWVRDERGARYVVSKDAILPPGWSEIPGPSTSAPQQPVSGQTMAPAYSPPAPPQAYQPPQQPMTYAQPSQAPAGSGDGMKLIEDRSGYRIKVAKDSPIPPGFREVSATPPPQPAPQSPYPPAQPMQPQVQTYQPQPNVYSSAPSVPNVPPTWQQQLPYQPPAPQFQNPTGPYLNQNYQPQPVPVVRSPPPGKKRVTDDSGLVYYVDEDTIIGPGMREVTDEELNRPPAFMMPQQQRGGGSFLGRLFGR